MGKRPAKRARPDTRQPEPEIETNKGLTETEVENLEEHQRLRALVVYEVVRQQGEEELLRPASSLWWSGAAAGLSIGFSLLTQALLHTLLPDQPWRPILESFGYCTGFLIVVLAREQLFTENTLTAVLPLMADWNWTKLRLVLRLWGIVIVANMAGALVFAGFLRYAAVLAPETEAAAIDIGRQLLANPPAMMFCKGIVSGWLIAAMVWILPSAEGSQFWVITLLTYLIALGGFTHIVAGSVEAFLLLLAGKTSLVAVVGRFALPTFLGNAAGGTALFALISYAQIKDEI